MEIGLSGHRGRIVVSHVIMVQEHEVEHVLIHLQNGMENHVRDHLMTKKDAINTHVSIYSFTRFPHL